MNIYYWFPYHTDYTSGMLVVIAPDDSEAYRLLTERNKDGYYIVSENDIRRDDLAIEDNGEWVLPVITRITNDTREVYEVGGGA